MPQLSARVDVDFESTTEGFYAMRGSVDDVAAQVRKFTEVGVEELALWFAVPMLTTFVEAMERFASEVVPLV
jgi:hypothetical protein